MTFTFSEKVSDATFGGLASGAGITVAGGTLSALVWDAGHTASDGDLHGDRRQTAAASVTVNATATPTLRATSARAGRIRRRSTPPTLR